MSPFRSKAQAKKLATLTAQGKFPLEAFKEWANETKNYQKLPNRLKKHATKKK